MTPTGYLLMPGRLPPWRCPICQVETVLPNTHVCVEPERGPSPLDLRRARGREVAET